MEKEKIEITHQNSLSDIIKAELDIQITTAKAFPRSIKIFLEKAESLVSINEEIAALCCYAYIRKEKLIDRGTISFKDKIIEGPSVRLAEIICSTYGNIRSGARVISNDSRAITAQGICHDLETNNFISVEVKRNIRDKKGRIFSEDMQTLTGNAACAIAFRNAVFKVIPCALINDIYQKAKHIAKGTLETLTSRREKALNYFKSQGISNRQILETLELKRIEDIDLEKLSTLRGMHALVENGESTLLEIFSSQSSTHQDKKSKTQQIRKAYLEI